MEISLYTKDEPQRFERIVLYPFPDLKRIWVRAWITANQDQNPNIEIRVINPDGTENNSIFLIAHNSVRAESTLHLRSPIPGATYPVVAELSLGMGAEQTLLDRREFDMTLVFRDPEAGQAGFGIGFAEHQAGPGPDGQ